MWPGKFGEFGEALAFSAEALVVAQVPVEDVELHQRHAVEVALDDVDGLKVAAYVDHEAAPAETRLVVDDRSGDDRFAVTEGSQLEQGFEAVHDADDRRGLERNALGGDVELVGLVLVDALDGRVGAGDGDGQAGTGWCDGCMGECDSGAELQARQCAADGRAEALVGWIRVADGEAGG